MSARSVRDLAADLGAGVVDVLTNAAISTAERVVVVVGAIRGDQR